MKARRSKLEITYNEKSASEILEYVDSFEYTDVASGSSDTISIVINDKDDKWIKDWFPEKGDVIKPTIVVENWNKENERTSFKCGTFKVDDFGISGRPISINIGALSIPSNTEFSKTKRNKVWENATLKKIAEEISSRYKLGLHYETDKIDINQIEQSETSDMEFLYQLCSDYDIAMKVHNDKIVIYDLYKYEMKDSIVTISESDIEDGWDIQLSDTESYDEVEISYTDPISTETLTYKYVGRNGGRVLKMSEAANNLLEAQLKAVSKLRATNREETTMSFKMFANIKIVAGICINIKGLYKFDGKYFVDSVKHELGDGYFMTLEVHKIIEYNEVKKIETNKSNTSSSNFSQIIKDIQHEFNIQFNRGLEENGILSQVMIDRSVLVRRNSRGSITKNIQKILLIKGFSVGPRGTDGIFGSETLKGIKEFQKVNVLTVDGCVGKNTWAKLLQGV